MGSAPSSQRGGKATQSETTPREPTNAHTPTDAAQVADMTKEHLIASNLEMHFEDARNTRGAALIPLAVNCCQQDPKKGNATPSKNAAAPVPSATSTNFVTKFPEPATGILSSSLGGVLGTKSQAPPGAVYPPQTLTTPAEFVTTPYTQDVPNRAVAVNRNILSTVAKQTDTRNASVRPRKKARRSRGKDKDANTPALEETENIPPATREDNPSQRRGRRPARAKTGARPAKQGRPENRAGGTEAIDSEKIAVTRLVADRKSTSRGVRLAPEAVSGDSKPTSRRANAGRTRGHGRRPSDFRSNNKASGNLSPRARADSGAPGALIISEPVQDVVSVAIEEVGEMPEVAKAKHARTDDEDHWTDTKDQAVPGQIAPPVDTHTALKDKGRPPVSTAEIDVSTVPPLPSSTRRRAKEYFQRRTRERSVGAETGPGPTTAAEQGRGEEPNPRLHVKEGASTKKQPARWNVSVNHDQFAFDPEASPFTPNATSSPRQGSLSSIGVQSFSSPTPLPPHGNRKVAPLALVKKSGKSDVLETIDSPSQPIPVTPHGTQGGQQEDAYTYYAGRNQAEQLAVMQLQAYYSWLAGNIPTSVGLMRASEHVDLSGGGGGLSGGVALGRQVGGGQGRVRGKTQSRNASGAYAHPKEHVVYSPHEHERTQLAPRTISQRELGRAGVMKTEQDELNKEPEAVAQRMAQKWDGGWGLREAPGREVGWSWGVNGAGTSTETTG
ncbi:hypothetical protein EDB92DRAFT_1947911 [Lactarius akahatsu]|uniref:Uncharacterized protein n=1 Tax=Lactarius akahatsu TaxID=416441 RepID=A0AAD4QC59_9AGAM|nr:hypothetical protein EDB92DRAFT_1947911 [Lactarius akahatsu]